MPAELTPPAVRRGSSMLLAIIGVFTVALLATAAIRLITGEGTMAENMQSGTQAMYLADQGLSQYYQNFKPRDNLSLPTTIGIDVDTVDGDIDTSFAFADYTSADLKSTDIMAGTSLVRISPMKMMTSRGGDVYMMDATVMSEDPRTNRPVTVRSMRTHAKLMPPISIRAALMAPAGVYALGKKSGDANRIILKGTRTDNCGVATAVPGLATPAGMYDYSRAKKVEITPADVVGHDTSTTSYQELKDSLRYNWTTLTNSSSYSGAPKPILIPGTYSKFTDIPWSSISKTAIWPSILVVGDVNLTSDYKGFGMLTVTGSLNVTDGVLKWDGLILVGKKLTVVDDKKKAHTHIKGAVATGLNCTTAEITGGTCRTELGSSSNKGEHLGVEYSLCNVQAAWAGMTVLRPMTTTRHIKLY